MAAFLLAACLCVLSAGCGQGRSVQEEKEAPLRHFPQMKLPAVCTEPEQARQYTLEHYWDAFFAQDGRSDSLAILGVANGEVEQALSNYIQILLLYKQQASPEQLQPLERCSHSIRTFFAQLEERQRADTAAHTCRLMTEMVARYLYDPNSPMRDEDLYLPFAQAVADSPFTRPELREAYRHEARMCALNRFGEQMADFRFQLPGGRRESLYGVNTQYILLFFSNPGCRSCQEIVAQLRSRPKLDAAIASGVVAVLNIYIDEDLESWRGYLSAYPENWLNGYDYCFTIRDGGDFNVRGIPSLYLLDAQKRVLMKDVPTERLLAWLDNL